MDYPTVHIFHKLSPTTRNITCQDFIKLIAKWEKNAKRDCDWKFLGSEQVYKLVQTRSKSSTSTQSLFKLLWIGKTSVSFLRKLLHLQGHNQWNRIKKEVGKWVFVDIILKTLVEEPTMIRSFGRCAYPQQIRTNFIEAIVQALPRSVFEPKSYFSFTPAIDTIIKS